MRRFLLLGLALLGLLIAPAPLSAATVATRGAASGQAYGYGAFLARDPFFSSVRLLAHADSFVDIKGSTLTPTGSAAVTTAQKKYGTGSFAFTGGTDVVVSSATAPLIGTGDFTVEGWVFVTTLPSGGSNYSTIISNLASGVDTTPGDWWLGLRAPGNLEFVASGATVLNSGSAVSASAWTHVVAARQSGNLRLFINGVQVGATTAFATSMPAYGNISFGKLVGDASGVGSLIGETDDLRVTVGVARYTTNFTPPPRPFPNR